ncbi:MAG: hypothetical protein QOE95_2596, partial [Gaiellaceae bacterium]|nr:hypothetical protein [Gaiellaceae bacterium]
MRRLTHLWRLRTHDISPARAPCRCRLAGVGHPGPGFELERTEVIMAAKRPDFRAEWAVQGSNLRPW